MFRMLTNSRMALALALIVPTALTGCDGGSFVPPPPPELSALPDSKAQAATPSIELIVGPQDTTEERSWDFLMRQEVSKAKVIFSVTHPDPKASSAQQAELIRMAVGRKPSVLLVEPANDPKVVEALRFARDRGVPVLLLVHGVSLKAPGAPFPLMTFAPFEPFAEKLVAAALKDADEKARPDDGHALVVDNPESGPYDAERRDALRNALKTAGVKQVEGLTVNNDTDQAKARIKEKVDSDPKLTIVLTTEAVGLTAALTLFQEYAKAEQEAHKSEAKWTGSGRFSFGGCFSIDRKLDITLSETCGLIDCNVPTFARQAFRLAMTLARGETVPPVTEVPLNFQPMPGTPTEYPVYKDPKNERITP